MDKSYKKQAAEGFERGRRDIETARLLYDQKGYTDIIAYHMQQAIEKNLKGYLILHGKKPPRIHELDTLLNRISEFDDSLVDFMDLCEKTSRYYIEARYPPGSPLEYEEIKDDLDLTWKLIAKIRAKAGISDIDQR